MADGFGLGARGGVDRRRRRRAGGARLHHRWRLELDPSAALEHVPLDGLPPINNVHVVDADRRLIYLSPTMATSGSRRSGTAHRRACHDPSRYHFVHGVSPDGKTLAFAEFATYMSFPTGTLDHPADPRGRRATGPHVELDRADRAVLAVRRSGPVGIGFIGGGTVSDT
jgi:hypothetical protein